MCGCASESARRLALGWPVSPPSADVSGSRTRSPHPVRTTLAVSVQGGRGAGHQCDLCMLFRLCAVALLATPRPVSRETVTQHDFKTFLRDVFVPVRSRVVVLRRFFTRPEKGDGAPCAPPPAQTGGCSVRECRHLRTITALSVAKCLAALPCPSTYGGAEANQRTSL